MIKIIPVLALKLKYYFLLKYIIKSLFFYKFKLMNIHTNISLVAPGPID